MLGNDFFICIPDRCLYIITRHYFHQVYRMLYISIQREELQDGIQDLRNAMSVTTDGDGIFSHGFYREVSVSDNKTVTVSHLT